MKKYDIYNWIGDEATSRLPIDIESQNVQMPKASQPELFIIKTNNYKKVYDTTVSKSLWDDTYCKYNQMGIDKTNPRNIKKCIHLNETSNLKEYKGTWKTDEYAEMDNLSIYNVELYKNKNNQVFYPVGSVWSSM